MRAFIFLTVMFLSSPAFACSINYLPNNIPFWVSLALTLYICVLLLPDLGKKTFAQRRTILLPLVTVKIGMSIVFALEIFMRQEKLPSQFADIAVDLCGHDPRGWHWGMTAFWTAVFLLLFFRKQKNNPPVTGENKAD